MERLRAPYANPFSSKDNSLQLAIARVMQSWLWDREVNARLPALLAKYKLRMLVGEFEESFMTGDNSIDLDKFLQRLFSEKSDWADLMQERWKPKVFI